MNESLLRIEPNYGIDFALPSATTRPAPAPEGAGEGTGETPPPPPGR